MRQTVVLHVRPSTPPVCRNPQAHGSTPVVMVAK